MYRPPACHYIFQSSSHRTILEKKKHLLVTPSFKTNITKFSIAFRGKYYGTFLSGDCYKAVSQGTFIKRIHESNTI